MKISFSTILSIVLCAVLILAAVCVGAYRGWSDERTAALEALSADGEMRALLEERGMDAANLAVVAARHLPAGDETLAALRSASDALLSGTEDAAIILEADAVITDTALQFADELPALASVQQSARDKTYVSMLTAALGKKSGLNHHYALLVEDFNQRLSSSLTGRLATLLGVDPLPVAEGQ